MLRCYIIIYQPITVMSRINYSILNQNTQIRKIFCAYHPSELLTNFCGDSNCLMPLCPNCIVEHTEQHFLESTKPMYMNLQDIIAETKQKCYQHVVLFENLNKSNDKIFDYLMNLRESIHNQLLEDKETIISQINAMFEEYEDKLFEEATKKYHEQEVYNKKQTVSITDFIKGQIQTLHQLITVLKGENCLAGLITYYANDSKIYEESIQELNQYIAKHQNAGKISININSQKLQKTFQQFCENNFVVEYLSEHTVNQNTQQQVKMKQSKINKEIKSLMGRLSRKNYQENHYKQNHLNQSNSDNKSTRRKSDDYYKIDTNEGQYSQINNEKFPFPSSYFRSYQSIRHHY